MHKFVENLLNGKKVEFKALGEVIKIEKGRQLNKDLLLENGKFPVINGGINPSGFWNEYNYDENLITISQVGASAGYVNFIKTKFWAGAHCYVIKKSSDSLDYKYIYYFLKNQETNLMGSKIGAGIPSISLKTINSIKIPLPPLSVQKRIVEILDKFTNLTAELTAELTLRKKQFQYYRDFLLSENKLKKSGYQ